MMGRPTELTDSIIAEVEQLLVIMPQMKQIGEYLGFASSTWRTWIQEGRKEAEYIERTGAHHPKKDIYLRFYRAYRRGLAKSEFTDNMHIAKAAQSNWQAAAWRLERRFPNRYARKDIEIAVKSALDDVLATLGNKSLSDDELLNAHYKEIEAQTLARLPPPESSVGNLPNEN